MKGLLTTLFILITLLATCIAQKESLYKDILSNTIDFPLNPLELPDGLGQYQGNVLSQTEGVLESQICTDPGEIIIQIGDSLYGYNLGNNTQHLLGKVIHGIAGSFDVMTEPTPVLVTTAFWDSVYLNNGSGWTYAMHHANHNFELIHVGAGRKTAYFMGKNLWFYNGVSDPVLIRSNINLTVADLVVDDQERAWILTGANFPLADTLRVIDSTGASICNIPFRTPVDTYNGYGMFIKGGIIYVGFGYANVNFHNTIVPLVFEPPYVLFGTPIPMIPDYGIDLGSCEKWLADPVCNMVSTNNGEGALETEVYPNPFTNEINIVFNNQIDMELSFYNMLGMKVAELQGPEQPKLYTGSWEPGIYYCISRKKGILIQAIKLVKTRSSK